MINDEKSKILNNKDLQKAFSDIEKKLDKNTNTGDFWKYVKLNPIILEYLGNMGFFKRNLWISYTKSQGESFQELISSYKENKSKLDTLKEEMANEQTKWHNVVYNFQSRHSIFLIYTIL